MRALSVILVCIQAIGCSSDARLLKRGPYVQLGNTDSITVVWQTNWNTETALEFGPTEALGTRIQSSQKGTTHSVSIAGLQSNTYYYYRVFEGDVPLSATLRFHTNHGPNDTSFDFVVFGDSGSGSGDMYRLAESINYSGTSFGLHTGDIIYPSGEEELYDRLFFQPYARFLSENVLYMSIGNHDTLTNNGAAYFDNFYLPTNDSDGTESFYSFDYGHAHFVALNSLDSTMPDSRQYRWLERDLASTAQPWKFVFFHFPPYTAGILDGDDGNTIPLDTVSLRSSVVPLFEIYGVDVVFSGHSHSYERTFPILQNQIIDQGQEPDYINPAGPIYIVTGGGGASLLGLGSSPLNARQELAHHLVEISMDGDRLTGRAISPFGVVIDEFKIQN